MTTARTKTIQAAIADVRGVKDLMVEPQIEIPQLLINLKAAERALKYHHHEPDFKDVECSPVPGN